MHGRVLISVIALPFDSIWCLYIIFSRSRGRRNVSQQPGRPLDTRIPLCFHCDRANIQSVSIGRGRRLALYMSDPDPSRSDRDTPPLANTKVVLRTL
jgi:hypothetical protein